MEWCWLVAVTITLAYVECTHIFTLDDFSKLQTDSELTKYVEPVMKRLKTFRVAVHPRIRLFYHLLQQRMRDYAHRTADALYTPHVYQRPPNS